MNRPILPKYIICMAAFFLAFAPANIFAATPSDVPAASGDAVKSTGPDANNPVVKFVQELGNKALTSLTAKDLPYAERSQRVRTLLLQYFDIHAIGKFVLGPYWTQATDAQKQEYFKLFEDMIVRTYTHRFADYSGQSFVVKGLASGGQGENGAEDSIVSSVIIQPNGPPVHVDWRVRNENGTYKIADVLVENVSMSITQRADFASIIQNGGGKVDALLTALKNRPQQ